MKKTIKMNSTQLESIIAGMDLLRRQYEKHEFPEDLCHEMLDLKLVLEDVQAEPNKRDPKHVFDISEGPE